MTDCLLCNEPLLEGEQLAHHGLLVDGVRRDVHRECMLRSVVGGIGHLEDHHTWCVIAGDSDGGRTYRQSSIEVDAWVHEHGVDAAVAIGP